jgi:hypothetical protein
MRGTREGAVLRPSAVLLCKHACCGCAVTVRNYGNHLIEQTSHDVVSACMQSRVH